ncbi:hypothetical protein CLV63_112158 [Murinocardiopsis flavida]|uniref:Uncharacterized protein n=1 Tax=Murinocardiopsis flavida TaxID=645275 RepID=A0A2P8DGD0_9ACTN|nr:hypothetical protein [Murinocardiopsis flavida]PSK96275.1 hypothetical protein CLV63_112158 [Murinocardiopsis flavida]
MLKRIHDPERGAGAVEYASVIVLVAAILAGLIMAGVPASVTPAVDDALCALTGGPECDEPDPGAPQQANEAGAHPAKAPVDDDWQVPLDELPSAKSGAGKDGGDGGDSGEDKGMWRPPEDEEWFEFDDRGDYNWDCGKVFDVACKIGGGFSAGGRDIFDGAASAACLVHICSHSGFKDTWGGATQIFKQSPITTGKQMWKGLTDPLKEDWRKGGPGKAISHGVPAAVGGLLKPFKLLKDGDGDSDKKEPDNKKGGDKPAERPGKRAKKLLDKARRSAERGDTEAADRAVKDAQDTIDKERKRARAEGCPVSAPGGGVRSGTPMVSAPVGALLLADGCDEGEQLARDIGVSGDREIDRILKEEKKRSDFYGTRKGKAAAKQVKELDKIVDETQALADSGDVKAARKRVDQAEALVKDLQRRARKEKDPERKRLLEDAVRTGEARLQRTQDFARTAAVVDRFDGIYASDPRVQAGDQRGKQILKDVWDMYTPVIDYEGTGPPRLDTAKRGADGETGRPVLHIDRSRYNSETEISGAVAQALLLERHGYHQKSSTGLRNIADIRNDGHNESDRRRYVERSIEVNTDAYRASVHMLARDGIEPANVGDPVLRGVYENAIEYADDMADEPDRTREDLIVEGVRDSMYQRNDGLGGKTPADSFIEEYDEAMRDRKGD